MIKPFRDFSPLSLHFGLDMNDYDFAVMKIIVRFILGSMIAVGFNALQLHKTAHFLIHTQIKAMKTSASSICEVSQYFLLINIGHNLYIPLSLEGNRPYVLTMVMDMCRYRALLESCRA